MKTFTFIFILFVLIFSQKNLAAQTTIEFFQGSLEEVFEAAKKENKAIFIDAYTNWCVPCKKMEANIFTRPEVHIFYNSFLINYKLDMFSKEGVAFAKKYRVTSYPTYLYLDANGTVNHKITGSKDAQKFITAGKKGAVNQTRLAKMTAAYKAGNRSKLFITKYLQQLWLANAPSYPELVKKYCKSVTSNDLKEATHQETIYLLASDLTQSIYQLLQNNKKVFENTFNATQLKNRQLAAAYNSFNIAVKTKDYGLFNKIITVLNDNETASSNESTFVLSLKFYEAIKDWKAYSKVACSFLANTEIKNAAYLNDVAWNFYEQIENPELLQKAVRWAAKSVELDSQSYNNDTYASLLHKLGVNSSSENTAEVVSTLNSRS
ncbi:MAG: thioredoxin family protein [Chitinophagales bacterium]